MRKTLSRWRSWWDALHDEQTQALEQLPAAWTRVAVVATSALALYVELVLVRWHASCFHAFAIFKNVSLLSCFLGLGIGYGLSGRRRVALAAFLPLLALQTLLFGLLSGTNLGGRRINPVAEQLVMGTASFKWSWLDAVEGKSTTTRAEDWPSKAARVVIEPEAGFRGDALGLASLFYYRFSELTRFRLLRPSTRSIPASWPRTSGAECPRQPDRS